MGDPLPYVQSSRSEWSDVAAGTSKVLLEPDEHRPVAIAITGPCPRCGHDSAHVEPLVLYTNLTDRLKGGATDVLRRALESIGADSKERDVDVICGCSAAHEGAPEQVRGCGASWVLHVEWDPE